MDELLTKLLSAEVLTEESRKELEVAFKAKLTEAEARARQDATAAVTAELNEKWITERDTLIEALDAKVSEALTEELAELKSDIERFRDLEAEYAEKLVEAKSAMAEELKGEMKDLVEKLDSFLEIRLGAEMEELREDIEAQKKKQFGQKMFEAFVEEFKKNFADEDSTEGKLNEAETRLTETLEQLEKAEKKIAKMQRNAKLNEVLKPLSGRQREVMEAILKNIDTPMLEDAYKHYVGRVLKETTVTEETSEKEETVLAEGTKEEVKGVTVDGDNHQQLTEETKIETVAPAISVEERNRLRRLAGIA